MKPVGCILAAAFAAAFVLTPRAARAEQSAKRAVALSLAAPDSVALSDLPQITPQTAASELRAPARARLHGVPMWQYALLKAQAATAKLPAPKSAVAQPLIAAGPLPPPAAGPPVTKITGFGGIGLACGHEIPPDMALAAGPSFVLQVINSCVAVFDKSGNVQAGFPKSLSSLMLVGPTAQAAPYDPRALFDWANQRYIVSAAHLNATGEAVLDVAVSQSSNPLGVWFIYHLNMSAGANTILTAGQLADFPTLGQDRRMIYVGFNAFTGDIFNGAFMLLLNKSAMYAGASFNFFGLEPSFFTLPSGEVMDSLQPANVMDRTDNPRAEFVVASHNINATSGPGCASGCSDVAVFAISNPAFTSNPADPGPEVSQVLVNTSDTYSSPPLAPQHTCSTPACLIDTGDTRVSGEVIYASGSLYAALDTNGTGNGASAAHILWFQIRPVLNDNDPACASLPNQCPQIVGASVLNEVCWACATGQGDGTGAAYYPEVQPDPEGDVLVVFNYSDDNIFPSSAYATNRATEALGTMHDSGFFLQQGLAMYERLDTNEINRWGDYTAASLDLTPGIQASFWFAGESSKTASVYRTAIGHNQFKRPGEP